MTRKSEQTILALKTMGTNKKMKKMNKLFLVLALLFALSACTIGQKCTYTQEGTKLSSWLWFTKEVPVDLSKENCN